MRQMRFDGKMVYKSKGTNVYGLLVQPKASVLFPGVVYCREPGFKNLNWILQENSIIRLLYLQLTKEA